MPTTREPFHLGTCECGREPGKCVKGDMDYCPAWDDVGDTESCPRCMGGGSVNCYCGGDRCFCENQGEKPCPVCGGEGDVTPERYDRFMKAEAENNRIWREAFAATEKK